MVCASARAEPRSEWTCRDECDWSSPPRSSNYSPSRDSVSDPSPIAIATSATVPTLYGLVLGLVLALVIDPAWVGVVVGLVVALGLGWQIVRRVRRRALTVLDDVLVAQRDQYRLIVPWQGIKTVQRRRHHWLMNVEELVCSGGSGRSRRFAGQGHSLPNDLDQHPALTRVMVSLYAKDWRQGPIGNKSEVSASRPNPGLSVQSIRTCRIPFGHGRARSEGLRATACCVGRLSAGAGDAA